jgi:hypothetical protein
VDPKELLLHNTDAWDARERGFFATCTEDCEVIAAGFTGEGGQGLREFWSLGIAAFPDNQLHCHFAIPAATCPIKVANGMSKAA